MIRESALDDLLEEKVRFWDAACEGLAWPVAGGASTLGAAEPRAVQGDRLYFRFDSSEALDRWIDAVRDAGGSVVSVVPARETLEEYFVDFVRRERDGATGAEMHGASAGSPPPGT
jgi:hypothetical protein